MPRLFFALTPDPQVRARIAEQARRLCGSDAGGASAAKFHVTLAFLGKVAPAPSLRAGARAAASVAGFDFALDETDSFHGGTWILRAPAAPFAALVAALSRELHAEGLSAHDESRAFVPHVTLRRRAPARLPRAPIPPIPWQPRTLCLYDSDLASGQYTRLGEWPLAAGDRVSS